MAKRFSIEAVFKAVDKMTAPVSKMQNRVKKFTRGMGRNLRRLNRQVGKLTGALGRGAVRVAKFGGAILGAVGTATVVAMNRVADAADKLAKQSRRLQFPIEDLQEWKFVAEQSGVSTELLDKSLGAFTKRLGEARGGQGPLVSGLKKLNPVLLEQLKRTDSVADAFSIYVDAMRAADSATEKAALANAAFSRSGLDLVNISNNSADAIKALRLEQRQNGNITMRQAMAAEAYNDAVNSLKRALAGLLNSVILPMLPAITKTVGKWREWVVANKELVQVKVRGFVEKVKNGIKSLVRAVVEFNNKYNIADKIGEGLDLLVRFGRFMAENSGLIMKLVGSLAALSVILQAVTAAMTVANIVMAANPVGLVVIAIAALIAILAAAVIWWDEIKAAMVSVAFAIASRVASAFESIKGVFASVPEAFKSAMSAMASPVGWLMDAVSLIMSAWSPLGDFFSNLWGGVTDMFGSALNVITDIVDMVVGKVAEIIDTISSIGSGVAEFFGFGDDDGDEQQANTARNGARRTTQVVSPQDRVARSIEERRTTSTAEVTIKDDTGRAEVTRGQLGRGLSMTRSGAF